MKFDYVNEHIMRETIYNLQHRECHVIKWKIEISV